MKYGEAKGERKEKKMNAVSGVDVHMERIKSESACRGLFFSVSFQF
jgi:hypothetical protein